MIKRLNIGPFTVIEDWTQRLMSDMLAKKTELIKHKCDLNGLAYAPERVVMIMQTPGKFELYYYQTDSGSLSPLVAITETDVSWDDSDLSHVRVKAEFSEVDMSIFKPNAQPV